MFKGKKKKLDFKMDVSKIVGNIKKKKKDPEAKKLTISFILKLINNLVILYKKHFNILTTFIIEKYLRNEMIKCQIYCPLSKISMEQIQTKTKKRFAQVNYKIKIDFLLYRIGLLHILLNF